MFVFRASDVRRVSCLNIIVWVMWCGVLCCCVVVCCGFFGCVATERMNENMRNREVQESSDVSSSSNESQAVPVLQASAPNPNRASDHAAYQAAILEVVRLAGGGGALPRWPPAPVPVVSDGAMERLQAQQAMNAALCKQLLSSFGAAGVNMNELLGPAPLKIVDCSGAAAGKGQEYRTKRLDAM